MVKKFILMLLLVSMLLLAALPAFASTMVVSRSVNLSFTGTTANCAASVSENGAYIEALMTLWQGNAIVDSWYDEGYNSVSFDETYNATSKKSYTLKIEGTVDGVAFQPRSQTKTCP